MRLPSLASSVSVALLLVGACFNPEPPPAAQTDDGADETEASTSAAPDSEPVEEDPVATTGNADPSEDASTSGAPESGACGDGVVQGGEECDLGADNSDEGACTLDCTVAVCGDGYVHQGAEVCDDGEASALCDADCTAPACGDGVTNPLAFEQCDGDDEVLNGRCESCVAVCNPGWSRCGGGAAAPCDAVIDSRASCEACGHEWHDVAVAAAAHVNVDDQWGPMAGTAFVQSAIWDLNTITGWIGFDLDDVPSPIFLADAQLEVHVMYFDLGPISDVVVDPSPDWTPSELTPGPVLAADFAPFEYGPQAIDLDLEAWDWVASVEGGWLSLGLVARGPLNSMLEVEGTFTPDMSPKLRLHGCF